MPFALEQLDRKKVAVEVTIGAEVRVLRGTADYIQHAVLGDCLRIAIDDPSSGELELLLRASEWAGSIALDDRHGCDYRIALDPACLMQ